MNFETNLAKYGQKFTQELELEERYRTLGMEQTQKAYDSFRTNNTQEITALQLGQKFLGHEFQAVNEAMQLFIDGCIKPKQGTKPTYVDIVSNLVSLYGYAEDNKDPLSMLLTSATFSTLLTQALKKEHCNSNLASIVTAEIWNEARLKAYCVAYPGKAHKVLAGVEKRVQAFYRRSYVKACCNRAKFGYDRWNKLDSQQLGACFIQVVLKASDYFEDYQGSTYEIIPSQKLLDAWSKNVDKLVTSSFKFCPMVIPPRDWESFTEGGYYGELSDKVHLLRLQELHNAFGKQYLKRLNQLELTTVKKAVNSIQSTPWTINSKVLAVVTQLLENGGGMAGLPYMSEAPKPMVLPKDPSKETIKEYCKVMVPYYRAEARRKSLALRVLAHMRVAKEFSTYDKFYIPCNMDFRGRIYPIPSFNFQGDDLNKSLIEFADTPALTDNSQLKWFYVTGANLAGVDKVSYEDRIAWVKEHDTDIMSTASDPYSNKWWQDQDCPLQFLAFCFEYADCQEYLKSHNGDIKGWHTGIVVAFDGTCSGLQHFSAILRDPVGGTAVNLVPQDKPNDIYKIVATKVNNVIEQDILNGTDDEQAKAHDGDTYTKLGTKSLALIWSTYGVTRKVTKRSVMTLAYGSKEYGFKDQLLEDTIKPDIDAKGDKSVFDKVQSQCAKYLAKLIWDAVGTTVVAAVEGMKWLQQCARLVAKEGKVVTWVTPAGLPVQQSYMEIDSTVCRLRCAGKRLRLYNYAFNGNVDDRHQVSGIAPNFIHSMDASHLQLTVSNCYDMGIRHYAMVHDSYGTCLANAQEMFDTVRSTFVKMYEDNDILGNFKADMARLTDKELPQIPSKSTLNLTVVAQSPYVFC